MELNQNFSIHEELIILNTLRWKYCVDKWRDISRDNFAKIVNNWQIGKLDISNTFGVTVHCITKI